MSGVSKGNLDEATFTGDDLNVNATVAIDLPLDLYENQKVAQPFTVFDVTFENHKQVDLFETILTGGATETYNANQGSRELNLTTAAGDKAILIQHGYNQFIDGKEFEIDQENNLPQKANVRVRNGYYNTKNGWFFESINGLFYLVGVSFVTGATVEVFRVERAAWSVDKLNGLGPSGLQQGVTIDISTFRRREIITQGTFGKTQFSIDIGGEVVLLHEEVTAEQDTPVYERASLPVCWEIENIGVATSATTMTIQSCAVKIYGEYDITGFPFSISTGILSRLITARTAIIGIKVKNLFGPGSKTPRGVIQMSGVNIAVSGGDVHWEILLQKGHLGESNIGGPPTWTGINRSTVDFTLDGTTVPLVTPTAGGEVLQQGYAIAGTGNNPGDRAALTGDIVHNITQNEAGNQSDYAILVATPTGNNATIEGAAMVWTEFK